MAPDLEPSIITLESSTDSETDSEEFRSTLLRAFVRDVFIETILESSHPDARRTRILLAPELHKIATRRNYLNQTIAARMVTRAAGYYPSLDPIDSHHGHDLI